MKTIYSIEETIWCLCKILKGSIDYVVGCNKLQMVNGSHATVIPLLHLVAKLQDSFGVCVCVFRGGSLFV